MRVSSGISSVGIVVAGVVMMGLLQVKPTIIASPNIFFVEKGEASWSTFSKLNEFR
jgi:hypothetical protein